MAPHKSTAAQAATELPGTAAESPAASSTSTPISTRVTRRAAIAASEFERLPNAPPRVKSTPKSTPKAAPRSATKATNWNENVPLSRSTSREAPKNVVPSTATAPVQAPTRTPAETPDRDTPTPTPERHSARARKQTERARSSWALNKAKEKAKKAKDIKDNMPRPLSSGKGKTRYIVDEADADADMARREQQDYQRRKMDNKEGALMWPAVEHDDGRIPETENDDDVEVVQKVQEGKKKLKRVTKRQSLMREDDDDDSESILYEPTSTPESKAKRSIARKHKLADNAEEETIVESDLSPSKKARNTGRKADKDTTKAAEGGPPIRCSRCKATTPDRGGWKKTNPGAPFYFQFDMCSTCYERREAENEKSMQALLLLIGEPKGIIKGRHPVHKSVESSSSRAKKGADKMMEETVEQRDDEDAKDSKTAMLENLKKARAAKGSKTHKSKASTENLRNVNVNGKEDPSPARCRPTSAMSTIEAVPDAANSPITATAPTRRSRRSKPSIPPSRPSTYGKATRSAGSHADSSRFDANGNMEYSTSPYYVKASDQSQIMGASAYSSQTTPWKELPACRTQMRQDGEEVWVSGYRNVLVDKGRMWRRDVPGEGDGGEGGKVDGEEGKKEREMIRMSDLSYEELEGLPNVQAAKILDTRKNKDGEVFFMVAWWWEKEVVARQLKDYTPYFKRRWPDGKSWEFMLGCVYDVVRAETVLRKFKPDERFCKEMLYGGEILNYEIFGREVGLAGYNLDGVELLEEDRALFEQSWRAKEKIGKKVLKPKELEKLKTDREAWEKKLRNLMYNIWPPAERWKNWMRLAKRAGMTPEEREKDIQEEIREMKAEDDPKYVAEMAKWKADMEAWSIENERKARGKQTRVEAAEKVKVERKEKRREEKRREREGLPPLEMVDEDLMVLDD